MPPGAGVVKQLVMASFDFIDATSRGYKFFWDEREMLIKLAAIPVAVKIASFILIDFLGMQENLLRQGLLFLPSFFAEGWLAVLLIRMVVLVPEDGPRTKERFKALDESKPNILLAGTLVFVLIKLASAFIVGIAFMSAEGMPHREAPEPSAASFIFSLLLFALMIWAFRLLWLYIPVAMGVSVTGFLKKIGGYNSSFYLLGAWLLAFVPFVFALYFFAVILGTAFPGSLDEKPLLYTLIFSVVKGVFEVVITIISTLIMTYGIRDIYENKNRNETKLF